MGMISAWSVQTVLLTLCVSLQMMPSSSRYPPGKCQKNLKSCPPGHEFTRCDGQGEWKCQQCGDMFFQPNENRMGDKCRLRKICEKAFMAYEDYGNTVVDAKCECLPGFHFENEDQRACVPNRECDKGLGQGEYGVCENCLEKMMYSDARDRTSKCKPLRNCEKESRCVKKKSNGTFDNICGPLVRDVNDCSSIVSESERGPSVLKLSLIIGGVMFALLLVLLIAALLLRRRRRKRYRDEPLTEEQLEELKRLILHKCEKDEDLSRKVLSESFSQIESRIDRQSWNLAQNLFRNHHITGKYELLVETYKDRSNRDTVRGYLVEYKTWRGENQGAVTDLFQGLNSCKRDDIVYEICNRMRPDVGEVCFDGGQGNSGGGHSSNRAQDTYFCEFGELFPCLRTQDKQLVKEKAKEENPETTNKLLEAQCNVEDKGEEKCEEKYSGEPVCGIQRAYPSAPVFDEANGLLTEPEVQFHRQYSQPVQATT